jgi:hypothetical protein
MNHRISGSKNMSSRHGILGISIIAWMPFTALGQTEQPLDFQRDVLPHLRSSFFPEDIPAISIKLRMTVEPTDGTPSETREAVYRFSPRGGLITHLRWDKPYIDGYNPWYAFRIERPAEEKNWKLVSLYMAGDPGYEEYVNSIKLQVRERARIPPVGINGVNLAELATFRSFRLTECKRVNRAGREYIQVSFEIQPSREEAERYPVAAWEGLEFLRHATIIIDPQMWITVERVTQHLGNIRGDSKVYNKNNLEYRFNSKDQLIGYNIHAEITEVSKKHRDVIPQTPTSVTWIETVVETPEDIPDREFMLTAFGLPEPKGVKVPGPWIPPYVWLIVAGVILAVLAYLLRRLARRRGESHEVT